MFTCSLLWGLGKQLTIHMMNCAKKLGDYYLFTAKFGIQYKTFVTCTLSYVPIHIKPRHKKAAFAIFQHFDFVLCLV